MIHVCLAGTEPAGVWVAKAHAATVALLEKIDPDERAAMIKKSSSQHIWKDLKPWLLALSFGKCWYSEARDIGSFRDVDHFRPKGRVVELDESEQEGYSWLTFDWENYRIACDLCNKRNLDASGVLRGKADYFPLRNPATRAKTPAELPQEEPYLLDPVVSGDPDLLSFDQDGRVVAAEADGWNADRAALTIRVLHLDHPGFDDARKQVCNLCHRYITRLLRHVDAGPGNPDFDDALDDLRGLIVPQAEFAGAARIYLLKSGHPIAEFLVNLVRGECACAA